MEIIYQILKFEIYLEIGAWDLEFYSLNTPSETTGIEFNL